LANLVLSKKIECPDYGEIEIHTFIPNEELSHFLKGNLYRRGEFVSLIRATIRSDAVDVSKFTDADYECITIELARNYKVDSLYSLLRNTKPREVAFRTALRKSSIANPLLMSAILERQASSSADLYRSLTQSRGMLEAIETYKILLQQNRGLQDALMQVARSRSGIEELFKVLHPPQIEDMLKEYAYINSYRKSWDLLREGFYKSIQASKYLLPGLSDLVQEISNRTNRLSAVLKSISVFAETFKAASSSLSLSLDKSGTLIEKVKLSNDTILASTRLVIQTNDYFSTRWEEYDLRRIPRLPEDVRAKGRELDAETQKSEIIVENQANKSIILTNSVAQEIAYIKTEVQSWREFRPLFERIALLQSPKTILDCLKTFSVEMQKNYFRVFWNKSGTKLIQNPERCAQSHLGIYLKGQFGGIAFVGKEIMAGNGFIDLFVHFLGDVYIVELKIVGNGWSIRGAEDGLCQLDDYMESYGNNESYMIIFDARKTDRGKQLNEVYGLDHGTVHVISTKIGPVFFGFR
jgi:hypothetical protein